MKLRFKIGEAISFKHVVATDDLATFTTGNVHNVCSTFALAKYIEWTSRLFVLKHKFEDEEGIGTFLKIKHVSPAFKGQEMEFIATIRQVISNELICDVKVCVGKRVVAEASTGQKMIKKDKLKSIFSSLDANYDK